MPDHHNPFRDTATVLNRLQTERRTVLDIAFEQLLRERTILAGLLVEALGTRQRAAYWMSTHHPALEGRTGWEALADGDDDRVWDAIVG